MLKMNNIKAGMLSTLKKRKKLGQVSLKGRAGRVRLMNIVELKGSSVFTSMQGVLQIWQKNWEARLVHGTTMLWTLQRLDWGWVWQFKLQCVHVLDMIERDVTIVEQLHHWPGRRSKLHLERTFGGLIQWHNMGWAQEQERCNLYDGVIL